MSDGIRAFCLHQLLPAEQISVKDFGAVLNFEGSASVLDHYEAMLSLV
jgi:hypothetical protein